MTLHTPGVLTSSRSPLVNKTSLEKQASIVTSNNGGFGGVFKLNLKQMGTSSSQAMRHMKSLVYNRTKTNIQDFQFVLEKQKKQRKNTEGDTESVDSTTQNNKNFEKKSNSFYSDVEESILPTNSR